MDVFILIIGLLFCLIGLIGSFIPIIPSPITSWLGLFIINFSSNVELSYSFLFITFIIAVIIFSFDLIIPMIGLKKFGGTNKGMIGATIGLLLGAIIGGPIGIIIGPFIGAISGELMNNLKLKKAIKASIGTLIGLLAGIAMKFIISIVYLIFYIIEVKDIFLGNILESF
ncbi:MAG: DUF456 domain-containing protein [Flavobacteriaceae bacterium]|jgi:uncharacterized protein|nr:DUF456 domain-containing protein [Flavobacteriaceae bacterium]MBT3794425.1 DUF456 domain-containing protein [Flavobacteriaceae bacterium]MBT4063548.1 DUF456 domain-containing protein [Flavobacteriaceae bacterium]MBT4415854.1 DUF456 domain-containing protein [Flavobacteriaceae bacterium]MBT5011901.1 DUF456 domain-containing protein [Flavobacteriaceae bacterium]